MSRLRRVLTTYRTHWKKSTFGLLAAGYGCHYFNEKRKERELMTEYCKEALKYGEVGLPGNNVSTPAYHVIVVLNPAAGGAGAKSKFEKYCEPLLHLAGFKVSLVRTEAEGQAKETLELMEKSDAILVAGGDGTLMEAVTGLMRRRDCTSVLRDTYVGILPVGNNNLMAKVLFPHAETEVRRMAEATMAVVRQFYRPVDIMQVENLNEDGKKVYCMSQIQLGSLKDAKERVDKYWFLPIIKKYLTYFFSYHSSAKNIVWNCLGDLAIGHPVAEVEAEAAEASPPEPRSGGLWSYILPSSRAVLQRSEDGGGEDASSLPTAFRWEEHGKTYGSELVFKRSSASGGGVDVFTAPDQLSLTEFVSEGVSREHNKNHAPPDDWRVVTGAESIRWYPGFDNDDEDNSNSDDDKVMYIDNQAFEIRGPIQITNMARKIKFFCSESQHDPVQVKENARAERKTQFWKMQTPSINSYVPT